MIEFFQILMKPEAAFLRYALLAGILASISFGMMGTYVVVRRISYIAGAIGHCILGGIGAALYLQKTLGLSWMQPIYGSIASGLLAAMAIGLISLYARQREDTVIGALWAIGMAIGIIFFNKIPGYVDPMSYLFGNILLISHSDLWLIAGLDILLIAVVFLFYNQFQGICFDGEFAKLRGVHTELYYLVLLCMTALSIVLLINIVGALMVVALLTLPAAVACQFSRRLWHMMLLSTLCCMVFTTSGLVCSYAYDLPSGPVIILISGAIYLAITIGHYASRNFRCFSKS